MSESVDVKQIRKRDGRIEVFRPEKILQAIAKAFAAVGISDDEAAQRIASDAASAVEERFRGRIPEVEDIQDIVEAALMKADHPDAAKAYILYRRERAGLRDVKQLIGVTDDLKLGVNAASVLKNRYLLRDEHGSTIETPTALFRRVARAVAAGDECFGAADPEKKQTEEEFYQMMAGREFLPNSPTLMNAGTDIGQMAACFVLPIEDSMESIFETLKHMALVHKSGGGTGFSFSRLRPKGDLVRSTMGSASGPISFMRIYDQATGVIKQGGRRRGANMAVLRVDHPDIMEFITAKSKPGTLENFNLSIGVTDAFMQAVKHDGEYDLVNPRNGELLKRLRAKEVFEVMTLAAWESGDPGLVFLDKINAANPTPDLGLIECTNPCGEVPLLPYESCVLGSINLSRIVEYGEVEWNRLRTLTHSGVHFLDNVIEVTKSPLPHIKAASDKTRKIGLGVMGLADMLIQLGIPYDSEEALSTAEQVMGFIFEEAQTMSRHLAEKRGPFPGFSGSVWDAPGSAPIRNATLTSIAPTGSISIIADASSGIEPLFAVAFVRKVLEDTSLVEINRHFENVAKARGFYSRELVLELAKLGSIQSIDAVPPDVRRLFVTALDIAPDWHVRMQAAFQKHVDNAVAKTVNLPHDASPGDVRRIYMLAYDLGCKGITIYRYGCRPEQVLYLGFIASEKPGEESLVFADSEYSGGCPARTCASG
ncbi:MAG TPA: adenosylcobalamin-dependent ribonucleoside-diphosphate reductase [Armatimonadota bacterium]|jgi:ribonucleoside-diphosphate reductase alpha chain